MIEVLKKRNALVKNVKKVKKVICPKCKLTNEFINNEALALALICKNCGQSLGFNVFH